MIWYSDYKISFQTENDSKAVYLSKTLWYMQETTDRLKRFESETWQIKRNLLKINNYSIYIQFRNIIEWNIYMFYRRQHYRQYKSIYINISSFICLKIDRLDWQYCTCSWINIILNYFKKLLLLFFSK